MSVMLTYIDNSTPIIALGQFAELSDVLFPAMAGMWWVNNNQDTVEMYRFFTLAPDASPGIEMMPIYDADGTDCIGFTPLTEYVRLLKLTDSQKGTTYE